MKDSDRNTRYTPSELHTITQSFTSECRRIFGEKLREVRLFGSCARNDYDDESDIDVMILVDMDNAQTKKYLDEICRISADMDLRYGIVLSPLLQNKNEYEDAKEVSGFFRNIEHEGVSLYAG